MERRSAIGGVTGEREPHRANLLRGVLVMGWKAGKLTVDDIRLIRKMRREGKKTAAEISKVCRIRTDIVEAVLNKEGVYSMQLPPMFPPMVPR